MARRRHQHEEHINHESWAIPYGDLITLLLAFFVVMYSISSVNEGKYRVLSQAISSAFSGNPNVIAPIQVGDQPKTTIAPAVIDIKDHQPAAQPVPLIPVPVPVQRMAPPESESDTPGKLRGEAPGLKRIADEVEKAMAPLIARDLVVVRRHETWLEVELKTDILFPSGVAAVSPQAQPILDQLSAILDAFPNPLRIEGYTDDVPIATAAFPSNWELSAARAAAVARMFVQAGVDPYRVAIVGWGQYRPIADNANAEGRNRNRRVLVVVLGNEDATLPTELGGPRTNAIVEQAKAARDGARAVSSGERSPAVEVAATAIAPATRASVVPGPGGAP